MKSPSIAYDDGEATTLMSTDADSLDGIAEMVHETWAQVIEVLIGIGLLASEALARALFARRDILLLDDTFSGLDGETEQAIFDNLFGVTGIIRRLRTTVVLVSNSSQYFQAADHIVVLGDHRIIDQGNWQNIKIKAASIAKFSSSHHTKVNNAVLSAKFDELSAQLRAKDETEIDLARQTGDPALYGYYLSFIDFENIFLLITSTVLYAFFITIPQYWVRLWTELGGRSTAFYVSGFLILSTLSWISTSAQMW
ncbi:uncharacterized protein Aud_009366 [Aspergillus udagawae]|uniref:Uncharacterized protein n=1 Tax=Aspergillus udagawae TaxID=91492 RepID=A0A8E0V3Q9_9EURO|nr:uncharacterized protein Aud_009366 [Aspergillus udagawae]GIC92891.1 hypothetical protein Aud_009366 [Aspergillus udagawae]